MGAILLRGLVLLFAFVAAMFVAVSTLFVMGTFWTGKALREAAPGDPIIDVISDPLGIVFFASLVTPALTALPALVLAVIGEVFSIRSFLYYVVAGGLALAAIPLLAASGGSTTAPSADYMTIFASAGFAGGAVYWLIAGRNAGR